MKKNFGQDVATLMNNTLFKTASADEDDTSKMHSHDSNCADDCDSTMKEEMSASDEVELALDNKEAAFQMAVDSLLSASAFLESMAEVRKSDFILKVAAKLVKEKEDKMSGKKSDKKSDKKDDKKDSKKDDKKKDSQKASDKKDPKKDVKKDSKDAKKDDKSKDKKKDSQKASDKKDPKKDEKKKSTFKDFLKSKKKG